MYNYILNENGDFDAVPMQLSEFIEFYGWDYDTAEWWDEFIKHSKELADG